MKTLTLTLDKDTERGLRELATRQGGRSVSSLVREALAGYLAETHAQPEKPAADRKPKR